MRARSTNTGMHLSNDLVSNVESSHGVQLTGGSTGGVVQAIGDDDNITLFVRGKGTGAVVLGSSVSTPQFLQNAAVGSTAAAAALGNIGGAAGPTAQAQVGWIKIGESSGGSCFVPYWK